MIAYTWSKSRVTFSHRRIFNIHQWDIVISISTCLRQCKINSGYFFRDIGWRGLLLAIGLGLYNKVVNKRELYVCCGFFFAEQVKAFAADLANISVPSFFKATWFVGWGLGFREVNATFLNFPSKLSL